MFYQLLHTQHSCSSTQSGGSILPSIVERRDQHSWGHPFLFAKRNLGSFCAYGTEILYTHSLWDFVDHSRSKIQETCLIIIHDPSMRLGPESNWGILDYGRHQHSLPLTTNSHNHLKGSVTQLGTFADISQKGLCPLPIHYIVI